MKEIDLYQEILGVSDFGSILDSFIRSLSDPQRTFNYFVDWEKVHRNVEKYKVEIGILGSLVGTKDIDKEMVTILLKYPEVLPVFPLIMAVRDLKIEVSDLDVTKTFSFKKRPLASSEINDILEFCKKTGLINIFSEIRNLKDYLSGVEVGMDTNARKNRSGTTMELMLAEPLTKLSQRYGYQLFSQKKFKIFEKSRYPFPENLKERKFDFALVHHNFAINIEANIYGGTGSKPQEIVDAYINRQKDLNSSGWTLIWITEGGGWAGQENQLRKGFEEMDYILNLHFVKQGLLEKIIKNLIRRGKP